jgi:antitoxin component of RelBE/YafQ-DinJ toxin-antitoxin module
MKTIEANDKTIIIRIKDSLKTEYESLLDKNGMNLSKRIKLLITEDIKKLKNEK